MHTNRMHSRYFVFESYCAHDIIYRIKSIVWMRKGGDWPWALYWATCICLQTMEIYPNQSPTYASAASPPGLVSKQTHAASMTMGGIVRPASPALAWLAPSEVLQPLDMMILASKTNRTRQAYITCISKVACPENARYCSERRTSVSRVSDSVPVDRPSSAFTFSAVPVIWSGKPVFWRIKQAFAVPAAY